MEKKTISIVYGGNGETVYNKYGIFEKDKIVVLPYADGRAVLVEYQGFREEVQEEEAEAEITQQTKKKVKKDGE